MAFEVKVGAKRITSDDDNLIENKNEKKADDESTIYSSEVCRFKESRLVGMV